MNVPATDINIPMPQIMSNSPTHSLPNVSYSGVDISDSAPQSDAAIQLPLTETPEAETSPPPSELNHTVTVSVTQECTAAQTVPPPLLQRAVSTSPRIERIPNDTGLSEDTNFGRKSPSGNDLVFFPLIDTSQDMDTSVSRSSGCLHEQNGNPEPQVNVRASDTVLTSRTGSNGHASSSSLERIRSGIQRVMRLSSQPSGANVSNPHFAARQDSVTSSRSGMATGNWYGSSIFGSKLFESVSTSSFGSQRINTIADSPSIEPVFSGYYSASCDESSFPHGELPQQPLVWRNTRFRTTSASSDLQSERFSSADSVNVSLQRTRSLPSKHLTSVPTETYDEVLDSVSDLPPTTTASGATAKRKWQMTMPELTEGPENETLSSHGQKRENLAAAALAIIRGEYKDWSDGERSGDRKLVPSDAQTLPPVVDIRSEKRRYIKNLLVMGAAYFFLFSSYFALRNLQSSLNAVGGLGLYALSSMYCALIFGSLFSTIVVQRLRPKRTMSLSLVGFVMYSAANFYPRFYTMIPASIAHGFFMAVGYTAGSTYLTNISAGYAELVGKQMKDVLSQFHGTYFVFLQFSQISGGLISSLLLSKPSSRAEDIHTDNYYLNNTAIGNFSASFCGSDYCPSDGRQATTNNNVDSTTLLILMGCFGASSVAGCIIMVFFLDPLEGVMKKTSAQFSQQMTAVFRFFLQPRARLVVGLSFYSLLQITFMFGEFTKVTHYFFNYIVLSVVRFGQGCQLFLALTAKPSIFYCQICPKNAQFLKPINCLCIAHVFCCLSCLIMSNFT